MAVQDANDGRVPIRARYPNSPTDEDPALRAWSDERLAGPGPYRPRFMVYSGLGSPTMTAERLSMLQEVGAESFLLAADLPSQLGFDPDHELAHAQVGRAGVSCATLDDFAEICSRLDLEAADSVGMLANSLGHIGLGMVRSVLRDRDAPQVKVVMQNDPLKEFTARGTEIHTPRQAVRIATDCVAYAIDDDIPGATLTICSNHYDVAGAGPLLAMAFAFGNAIAYMDELLERGYLATDVARKLMFFLNERSDLFVEASVFRSARTLWSEILRDRYGVPTDKQPVATLMGYAHGLESAAEPLVNIPRVTLSVLGSMMGGVDYLCATGYDEALRIPSLDASALAVRTMQVVAYEHGASLTLDPLGGSAKTRDIDDYVQTTVRSELGRLLDNGGPVEAIENGYIAGRIDENRGARQKQISNRERLMVGHTAFEAAAHADLFDGRSSGEIDFLQVEQDAIGRMAKHKQSRDPRAVARSVDELRDVAAGKDNLLPVTIAALRAGATTEEIVKATGEGFAR
ncbi:methylmalonyl-CoA mutase family protein [Sciscionella marina]|uniref:methylmalonyl-CoA mutase family protein n=1 Tax=Sciscionella marina TaxID=508770 RepID=UPI000367E99D|nr:methylmalonyl-CoA mutase family protein [Sciscionella marina]